jgi:integrase/recombinase XerD
MMVYAAVDEFLLACRADGLSKATVKWYTSLLRAFSAAYPVELNSVTTRQLREYITDLRDREPYTGAPQRPSNGGKMADSSVSGHIRALHTFWAFCAREYEIPNPMRHIKRPKIEKKLPTAVAAADVVKLLECCGDDVAGKRDRALICFLMDTGCRLGGLVGLKLEHLYLEQRRALVTEKPKKSRIVVFTYYTARMLRAWLSVRPAGSDALFVNLNTGEPLTESGVSQALKRKKRKAGVRGRANPHAFRHGFAREYLKNGGDLATLARLLGHENISTTTDFYAVFSEDELAELHQKFSPLTNLKSKGL